MSAGDHRGDGSKSSPAVLKRPAVRRALGRPVKINRGYDVPYLAGYSKDGRTIYIDRHLPISLKIGARDINVTPYLLAHERTEKALIDAAGYDYAAAHEIATGAEHRSLVANRIDPAAYEKALAPYIKGTEKEKIAKAPPELDLTPYRAPPVNAVLLRHLQSFQGSV